MTENTDTAPFWTKRVLTVDEVVAYTGFKKSYLYILTSTGQIPFSKPNGKSIFFDREKIEEWLLRNPQKSKHEIEHAAMKHITGSQKRKTLSP